MMFRWPTSRWRGIGREASKRRSSCSKPSRVDDAVRAFSLELSAEEVAFLEEPYVAHDLVGPLARPGEKALTGTVVPQQPGQKNA